MTDFKESDFLTLLNSRHLPAVKSMLNENTKVDTIAKTLGSLGFKELEGEALKQVIRVYSERKQIKGIHLASIGDELENIDSTIPNIRALLMRGAGFAAKDLISDSPLKVLDAAKILKAIFDAWQSINKTGAINQNEYEKECIEMKD